jgi:uncharacterized protein YukE
MALQIDTPGQFAVSLLHGLGAPVTVSNVQFIIAWANEEGGNWHNAASFNPLNTTLSAPGAVSMNSVGVKAYTSWDQGVAATVATLKNGRYDDIVAAFQGGNASVDAVSAAGLRTWSGGGYGTIMRSIPGAAAAAQQAVAAAGGAGAGTTSGLSLSGTTGPARAGLLTPDDLNNLARVLDQRADGVDNLVERLATAVDTATWSGPTADAFRQSAQPLEATVRADADALRAAASDLGRLADQLQQEIDQLRMIEDKVRAWLAANPTGATGTGLVAIPSPWSATNLPPTADPRWRDIQAAFTSAGTAL